MKEAASVTTLLNFHQIFTITPLLFALCFYQYMVAFTAIALYQQASCSMIARFTCDISKPIIFMRIFHIYIAIILAIAEQIFIRIFAALVQNYFNAHQKQVSKLGPYCFPKLFKVYQISWKFQMSTAFCL